MRKLTQRLSAIIVAGLLLVAAAGAAQAVAGLAAQTPRAGLVMPGDTGSAREGPLASIAILVARRAGEVR